MKDKFDRNFFNAVLISIEMLYKSEYNKKDSFYFKEKILPIVRSLYGALIESDDLSESDLEFRKDLLLRMKNIGTEFEKYLNMRVFW